MKELDKHELVNINGGTENCPAEKGRRWTYYVGYAIGWVFD
ncbi:hypothetical protein [Echinicola sediminis]